MDVTSRFGVVAFETTASGRVVAACACGWRSTPAPSAGRAGSLVDAHCDELDDHVPRAGS